MLRTWELGLLGLACAAAAAIAFVLRGRATRYPTVAARTDRAVNQPAELGAPQPSDAAAGQTPPAASSVALGFSDVMCRLRALQLGVPASDLEPRPGHARERDSRDPPTALGRSLHFGRWLGALAVLQLRGHLDPDAARASIPENALPAKELERLWERLTSRAAPPSAP